MLRGPAPTTGTPDRPPVSAPSPVSDHAAGSHCGQPAGKGCRTHPGDLTILSTRELARAARLPRRREIEHEDVDQPQRDRRKFDVEERVPEILRRLRGQKADA